MEIDENGVVNPLRAPAFVRDGLRSVRALPPVALVFVALAGAVLIGDLVDRQSPDLFSINRAVTVLFPTALLWRRADAAAVTPRLFRGTVLLAAAVIAGTVIGLILSAVPNDLLLSEDTVVVVPRLVPTVVASVLSIGGWVLVAASLSDARPRIPGVVRVVAATPVVGLALANGGLYLLALVIGGANWDAMTATVATVLGLTSWVVTAAVGWVLVTRVGGRPRLATYVAAAAVALQAIGWLPVWASQLISSVHADDLVRTWDAPLTTLARVVLLAPFLFAVAFATGLGDPPEQPVADPHVAIG
jgi:flagellar biosynthesis protein FliQ